MSTTKNVIRDLTYTYIIRWLNSDQRDARLDINYAPLIDKPEGGFSEVSVLSGNFVIEWDKLPTRICQKIKNLERLLNAFLVTYKIPNKRDSPLLVEANIIEIQCYYNSIPVTQIPSQLRTYYHFPIQPSSSYNVDVAWKSLSSSQQLVVRNLSSWVKKASWKDLAKRIKESKGQTVNESRYYKVFVSYKRNSKAEKFADTITKRLSQEDIDVWFDKWEIKAGDSIPGKIGEGFKDSDACLIFLNREYSESEWCTMEMNIALTKAKTEGLTIIPCIVEKCDVPELLKVHKRVEFIKQTQAKFETKFTEITDAIYKVDLNPYR